MPERYGLAPGVAVVPQSATRWFVLRETDRQVVSDGVASEVLRLLLDGQSEEDQWVEALASRYPAEQVYFAAIQLRKKGIIAPAGTTATPDILFHEALKQSRDQSRVTRAAQRYNSQSATPVPDNSAVFGRVSDAGISSASRPLVRVLSVGGLDPEWLGTALRRSTRLEVQTLAGWREAALSPEAVYVVATPDYLEPELARFGSAARERGLRWLPIKAEGVIPWVGPLLIPGQTGCLECLLDRVRGHRRPEVEQMAREGLDQSLRLSVGWTAASRDTVAGLLATELDKLAEGAASTLVGAVWTLDFRTTELERHPLTRRRQCPACGEGWQPFVLQERLPAEPLQLQARPKTDYRDGGERICSAVETLEAYAHLVSPVTGVVSGFAQVPDVPACFGAVVNSDWIMRPDGARHKQEVPSDGDSPRASAVGYSTGKGRTLLQSRASALGEALERYSSQFEGYEPRTRATYAELGDMAIPPHALLGFSARQYAEREKWRALGGTLFVPDPYDETRAIDWTPAWSLTRRQWRLVPSAFAYYAVPPEAGGDICRGDSNGVAAGNCLEEAIQQGLFELVERDAVAMWWYHRLRRPAVDWRSFNSPFVERVAATLQTMEVQLELLDLTHDLGLPVFSASVFRRNGGELFKCNGFGCHRDPRIAMERAVSELGQSWHLRDMDTFSVKFQSTPLSRESFLRAAPDLPSRGPADFDSTRHEDFLDDIQELVARLERRGLEILVIDLTRPDVGFSVARVIVPGIVHFWPRFGTRRLYEVPRMLGWVSETTSEDDLNPVPFCW